MKKIIIMSLALFAFALVGCGEKDDKKGKDDAAKKAECDKDATKQWNDTKKECEAKTAAVAVVADYTVKNSLEAANSIVTVSAEGKKDLPLAKGECGLVKGDAAKVKIEIAEGANVLCDSSDADAANDCAAKNQEVKAAGAATVLADAAAAAESCKEMIAATVGVE